MSRNFFWNAWTSFLNGQKSILKLCEHFVLHFIIFLKCHEHIYETCEHFLSTCWTYFFQMHLEYLKKDEHFFEYTLNIFSNTRCHFSLHDDIFSGNETLIYLLPSLYFSCEFFYQKMLTWELEKDYRIIHCQRLQWLSIVTRHLFIAKDYLYHLRTPRNSRRNLHDRQPL